METVLLDRIGRRRSPATMPGCHVGRPPRNKGQRYPADPPPVEEIIRVIRTAGDGPAADRLRGLIVVLWRSGLRISEALALAESDLDRGRGAIRCAAARAASAARSAWTTGAGNNSTHGSKSVNRCLSGRSSASSAVRRAVAHGHKTPFAYSYGAPLPKRP
jgi:hypothetical protein